MARNFDSLSKRIHMDFHTPDISWDKTMKNFDAKEYVGTLRDANVNSLVSFAKCHHGYSYYNTKLGIRHPSLPQGLDLLGELIDECYSNDIKVLIYYSVGWLTPIQRNKPEWMERNSNGQTLDTQGNPHNKPWAMICLNSPYVDEMVLPELREIIENYDAEGIWLDIVENQACHCIHCKKKYRKQFGREMPDDDSLLHDFVTQTKYEFIKRCRDLMKSIKQDWVMTYNTSGVDMELVELVDFCSIETHPGAPKADNAWAQALLTYKTLQSYEKPWESCSSRFIHGWGGWDDQPLENMKMSCSRILSHGGLINLGDQAYPDATIDRELYKKIGKTFEYVTERDKWALGSKSVPYVALLTDDHCDVCKSYNNNLFGAIEILSQNHWAFDIIKTSAIDKYADYKCIVVPELEELSDATISALEEYVANGGNLLSVGNVSYDSELNDYKLAEVFGCNFNKRSDYSTAFIKVVDEIGEGVRRSPLLIPDRIDSVSLIDGAKSLAENINPVIEADYDNYHIFRNGRFSPPGDSAGTAGIIYNEYGKGKSVLIPPKVFTLFNCDEQWYISDIVNNVLEFIVDDKLFTLNAPLSTEMNVTEKDGHIVCHLVQYFLATEAMHVREIVPALDVELGVSTNLVRGEAVMMPSGEKLAVEVRDGKVWVTIPKLEGYTQIVFPKAQS